MFLGDTMENLKNTDLFNNLKLDIIKICIDFTKLKQDIILLLITNNWILEDINLFENYVKLQEIIKESDKNLTNLINKTIHLEDSKDSFLIEDIISEFNFIRENIDLEIIYFVNMIFYMELIDNYFLSTESINLLLDMYLQTKEFCYSNMKINNKQLKILKKERGDYFE